MNATRAATIRGRAWVGGVVSLGRVQTPTLAMIVKREREIQAFVARAVLARRTRTFDPPLPGPLVRGRRDADLRATSPARTRSSRRSPARTAIVESVERKEQSRARAAPLRPHLAPARREPALRLLGAPHAPGGAVALRGARRRSPTRARAPATSPATWSPQLKPTAEHAACRSPTTRRRRAATCSALDQLPARSASSTTRRSTTTTRSSRPTSSTTSTAFSPDERRIFDLVARRFLAVFHPPARYARTTVITLVEEERFRTRGKVTLEAGWRARLRPRGRPTSGRPRTRTTEGAELPAARAGPDGRVRRGRDRGARRRSRRPATPRRRCSRRWRRPAS